MGTSTTTFGTSRHESHDSSEFYRRFDKVVETTRPWNGLLPAQTDRIYCESSETMTEVPDDSVALVVTSPPYNVGKDYDVDQPFDEYLDFLYMVLSECYRVIGSGGRAAINVANLGRKPYTALTTYVDAMCMDIGFFPRAQIVWQKGEGANGSCAWGSFQSASNPVIRDVNEFILIYSKDRFGRPDKGISTVSKEDFMRDTLSVWKIPPEHAKKIGHPAPFPVELPRRLINLYTYEGDTVLDPFMGSGTTAVAAVQTGRKFIGYENDLGYFSKALVRVRNERKLTGETEIGN